MSVKTVKRIKAVTRALEEIARIKLADIVNKRRSIKVEITTLLRNKI